MLDLHLHSNCSDGDVSPSDVVRAAKQRGLTGIALTDHNGTWGIGEAEATAREQGLTFMHGIEVSTFWQGLDIHLLGLSSSLNATMLSDGLTASRRGCWQRIAAMVERCQAGGYDRVSLAAIEARRQHLTDYCPVSYDVAYELQQTHQLPVADAHSLTVKGGACYVPYGDWAPSPVQAVDLIHRAGGVAVLAHPGILLAEGGKTTVRDIVTTLVEAGLDGLEVWHPFHSPELIEGLSALAEENELLMTGGSDWHGPSRFAANHLYFGKSGAPESVMTALLSRLAGRR